MKNNRINIMFRKSFKSGLTGLDWLLNVLIGIFGLSKYSHVELVLPGNIWISSTMKEGVRATVERKEGEWDKVSIDLDDIAFGQLVDRICTVLHKEYDYLATLRHAIPLLPNDKDKYNCSELVAELLKAAGIVSRTDVSVKRLYWMLIDYIIMPKILRATLHEMEI